MRVATGIVSLLPCGLLGVLLMHGSFLLPISVYLLLMAILSTLLLVIMSGIVTGVLID